MSHDHIDAKELASRIVGPRFVALAEHFGGAFKKTGTDYRGACFLHGGDGPNLVLSPDRGLWNCITHCGGGDVFTLVERAESLDFPDALRWLHEWDSGQPTTRHDRTDTTQRMAPGANVDTAPFMAEIWRLVESARWSARAEAYLQARGIEPDAAYSLGCRDWTTRREDLRDLFERTPADTVEAAGFGRKGGWRPLQGVLKSVVSGADGLTWTPEEWAGIAVPYWPLGSLYPTRWRWRLFDAIRGEEGQGKARSPIGGGTDLLGVRVPPALPGSPVRVARLGDGCSALLIVEGEPDWWSAVDAVDGRAVVLAVTGAPRDWRRHWPTFGQLDAAGIANVAVAVHHGKPDDQQVGHGETFARALVAECAQWSMGLLRKLPAEGRDLNDLHRAGQLRAWLDDLLEGVA